MAEGMKFPSTYRQVVENMQSIVADVLPKLDEIKETVEGIVKPPEVPDPKGTSSDVAQNPGGGLKVYGVTILVDTPDADSLPNTYIRDVTYELKKRTAIGLTDKPGFSLDHCLVCTFRKNYPTSATESKINYTTWQLAYGDENMAMYFRKAVDDNSWGKWINPIEINVPAARPQFVQEDEAPEGQRETEYWMEPIY